MTARAKRVLDLTLCVPAFVLSLPVQAVVAVLIAATLGRPVLFRQARPGLRGEPFVMVKFRTMHPVDRKAGRVDDASRLTRIGQNLRSMSLDELPTLWNVMRGDMSLVGPRPLLMEYLDRYSSEQARRHEVLPGLTGLAQVSGRNALSWEDKLALDVEYVERRSIWLDLQILARTVKLLVRRDGITADGEATMPMFTGSESAPQDPG